ncbi:MAG: tRNA lysidine(34) synthetase TilS [Alphaproteobacteria bacterium]|nr:tRNA lysidine(34) synthetase TilS [Alphaproteobacteria bacterium]
MNNAIEIKMESTIPISDTDFSAYMQKLEPFEPSPTIAVAVSGGADSMALCLLADKWAKQNDGKIVAVTVDHHLRPSSTDEANKVHEWLTAQNIEHHILDWENPVTKGLEAAARNARYKLLNLFCKDNGILHLMLAHHIDDQAETFLMRLERGSGVYGLSSMAPIIYKENVRYLRPMLDVSRERIHATCHDYNQEWFEDESNYDDKHKRVRFRKLLPTLTNNGLDSKTLAATAQRMANARNALEYSISELSAKTMTIHPAGFALMDAKILCEAPTEIGLRTLSNALTCIGGTEYPPRLERLERLYTSMALHCAEGGNFNGATLSGCTIKILPKSACNSIKSIKAAPDNYTILICKELASVDNKIKDLKPMHWDNRFAIETNINENINANVGEDNNKDEKHNCKIAPIGHEGWKQIKKSFDKIPLPKDAIYPLPAVYLDDELIEAPLLGYKLNTTRHLNDLIIQSVYFKPLISISGTYT